MSENSETRERTPLKSTGTQVFQDCSSAGSSLGSLQPRWIPPDREQAGSWERLKKRRVQWGSGNGTGPSSKELAGAVAPSIAASRGEQRPGRTEGTRRLGKKVGEEGDSAGAPRVDQAATGLGAVVAAGQVGSSWGSAHHHWGSAHAPTHPRSRRGSRTARGRCGQPCLRLLQCATRPHRRRPGRGRCTDPPSLTFQPPPPRRAHRSSPTAGRADTHMGWPDKTTANKKLRTAGLPNPGTPHL